MQNRLSLVLAFALVFSLGILIGERMPLHSPPVWAARADPAGGLLTTPPSRPVQAPITPGLHYKLYHGRMFQTNPDDVVAYATIGGCLFFTTGSGNAWIFLELPQGAEIREFVVFYLDNNAANDIEFGLFTYEPDLQAQGTILRANSSGASAEYLDLALNLPPSLTVDNTRTNIFLRVHFFENNSTLRLCGARVGYTLPTAFIPFAIKSGATSW